MQDEEDDFGQAEAQLAEEQVGEPEKPKYEWLVDFALSMDGIRADNFNPQQTKATLEKYGLPVQYQSDWIELMNSGDTESFLKGVQILSNWVRIVQKPKIIMHFRFRRRETVDSTPLSTVPGRDFGYRAPTGPITVP